jgi:hypothetical protein
MTNDKTGGVKMDEVIQPTDQPTRRRTGRRMVGLVLGSVLLLVLLVGAAFVGGRLLARRPTQSGVIVGPGGNQGGVVYYQDAPAPERPEELPDEEPDVAGVFTRRDGNSLFVGTGSMVSVSVGADGAIETEYDGPELEIVVTHDTEIYEERIEIRPEEGTAEHTLKPGSVEDIGVGSMVQVWGEKRGDRVTARVLVYQS